jgi:hypothetical protein
MIMMMKRTIIIILIMGHKYKKKSVEGRHRG